MRELCRKSWIMNRMNKYSLLASVQCLLLGTTLYRLVQTPHTKGNTNSLTFLCTQYVLYCKQVRSYDTLKLNKKHTNKNLTLINILATFSCEMYHNQMNCKILLKLQIR